MKNKFIPGVLIGAVIGGAVTLADKSTRSALKTSFKNLKDGNPNKEPSKFSKIKDEVLYWKDAVDELRRNNPQLEQSLLEVKDLITDRKK